MHNKNNNDFQSTLWVLFESSLMKQLNSSTVFSVHSVELQQFSSLKNNSIIFFNVLQKEY